MRLENFVCSLRASQSAGSRVPLRFTQATGVMFTPLEIPCVPREKLGKKPISEPAFSVGRSPYWDSSLVSSQVSN